MHGGHRTRMLWLAKQNKLMHFVVPCGHIHVTSNEHLNLLANIMYYITEKKSNLLQKIYCSSVVQFINPVKSDEK